jgi:hypothetical protein
MQTTCWKKTLIRKEKTIAKQETMIDDWKIIWPGEFFYSNLEELKQPRSLQPIGSTKPIKKI